MTSADRDWVALPGCDVRVPRDGLVARLSEFGCGWSQVSGFDRRALTLGMLDAAAIAVLKSASPSGKVALSVARVEPGISLGPAMILALTALVSPHGFDTSPFPIRNGDRVAIASRSHAVRDLLAESVLKFGSHETRVCQFPTFRIKRNGELSEAYFGRIPVRARPKLFQESVHFVLYDFIPMRSEAVALPKCEVVLAELSETDRPDVVDRLFAFADSVQASTVLPIVNFHDLQKRKRLEERGFTVLAIQSESGIADATPTFRGIDLASPAFCDVLVTPCGLDSSSARALAMANAAMADVWKACAGRGESPPILRTAWRLLDDLATAPVPLQTVEAVRRDTPGITTIGHAIERLGRFDVNSLAPQIRDAFLLRWGRVRDLIEAAYRAVMDENPLYEPLVERIVDAREPLFVGLASSSAAAALRRDLLVGYGWQDEGLVTIGSSVALARKRSVTRNLLAVGFDGFYRPQMHFSGLPQKFEILTYPHLLAKMIAYKSMLDAAFTRDVPRSNAAAFCISFGGTNVKATGKPVARVQFDVPASAALRFASDLKAVESAEATSSNDVLGDETLDVYGGVEGIADSIDDVSDEEPSRADGSSDVDMLMVRMTDGSIHRYRDGDEFIVLPADDEVALTRSARELEPGDRLVLLDDGEHKSVFRLIVDQTRHLVNVDDRALQRWEDAMDAVRSRFPPADADARDAFCAALEDAGCRRHRATMRTWIIGKSMAPESSEDVAFILRLAGFQGDHGAAAEVLADELNVVRHFRRSIGRGVVRRLAQRATGREARGRLDEEIDEVLDLCEVRIVESVAAPGAEDASMMLPFG